ncbi:type II toxin-antitoxin system prevent-host-death family antitoxin [Sphingomonas naphthae]|uniref:Antitoxin n=1 Tax=Sphingomonas naphthae TaxID=1813468 RepID=A0ABY7TLZ1_9SPHN|nr:type II toxin-antitoxin system prevent-host-death family antitoxin [Sphingomonas naphthae]WCT74053.1 type II toxin-antitoxin system prevent-host-death family antitoxin [Sphingomonas naphthae]
MTTVTVHEAKTHLSRLIAEVEAGGEVVIARGKEPVVKLVAVKPKRTPQFGALKGKIGWSESFWDPLPEDELRLWNGEGD